jgi:hypothetical protein
MKMKKKDKIAALFVLEDGPYVGLSGIDPWGITRDARKYDGPYKVIAHPPCERWGRYWAGGPSASYKRKLGDDNGCFESALLSCRWFGGVIEHPEASQAFKKYKLPLPSRKGGWTWPDKYGGRSACVAQGNYGHPAQKLTWIYAVLPGELPELKWGLTPGKTRMDAGFHSTEARRRAIKTGVDKRLSARQRKITPEPFKELLIELVRGAA